LLARLHAYNSANNIDVVDSLFEGSPGPGPWSHSDAIGY
jgi:hypothetical protein